MYKRSFIVEFIDTFKNSKLLNVNVFSILLVEYIYVSLIFKARAILYIRWQWHAHDSNINTSYDEITNWHCIQSKHVPNTNWVKSKFELRL